MLLLPLGKGICEMCYGIAANSAAALAEYLLTLASGMKMQLDLSSKDVRVRDEQNLPFLQCESGCMEGVQLILRHT